MFKLLSNVPTMRKREKTDAKKRQTVYAIKIFQKLIKCTKNEIYMKKKKKEKKLKKNIVHIFSDFARFFCIPLFFKPRMTI